VRRDRSVFGFPALRAPAAVWDVVEAGPVEGCAVGAGLGAGEEFGDHLRNYFKAARTAPQSCHSSDPSKQQLVPEAI
jgi:hypothetical protein